ncbi:MAG: hypothetical protein R3E35_06470 [Rhodocyclaceae bacterium]|jgi:hypothetical protein
MITKSASGKGLLLACCLQVFAAQAADADDDASGLLHFVPGRFTLIGRHPDSPATYSGTAKIERAGRQLRLVRSVAGKSSTVIGSVRRADPGEAWVLAFKWGEKQPMEMVCLVNADLDNYARLTCHWGKAGNPHAQPGMEAYFAQEPWEPVKP